MTPDLLDRVGVSENNVTFDVNDLTVLSYLLDCLVLEFWIYYSLWLFGPPLFPVLNYSSKRLKSDTRTVS